MENVLCISLYIVAKARTFQTGMLELSNMIFIELLSFILHPHLNPHSRAPEYNAKFSIQPDNLENTQAQIPPWNFKHPLVRVVKTPCLGLDLWCLAQILLGFASEYLSPNTTGPCAFGAVVLHQNLFHAQFLLFHFSIRPLQHIVSIHINLLLNMILSSNYFKSLSGMDIFDHFINFRIFICYNLVSQ